MNSILSSICCNYWKSLQLNNPQSIQFIQEVCNNILKADGCQLLLESTCTFNILQNSFAIQIIFFIHTWWWMEIFYVCAIWRVHFNKSIWVILFIFNFLFVNLYSKIKLILRAQYNEYFMSPCMQHVFKTLFKY